MQIYIRPLYFQITVQFTLISVYFLCIMVITVRVMVFIQSSQFGPAMDQIIKIILSLGPSPAFVVGGLSSILLRPVFRLGFPSIVFQILMANQILLIESYGVINKAARDRNVASDESIALRGIKMQRLLSHRCWFQFHTVTSVNKLEIRIYVMLRNTNSLCWPTLVFFTSIVFYPLHFRFVFYIVYLLVLFLT